MKDYDVIYKDEDGCKHEVVVTAPDVRVAINNTFELHTDCKQIIRAVQTPMFTDDE